MMIIYEGGVGVNDAYRLTLPPACGITIKNKGAKAMESLQQQIEGVVDSILEDLKIRTAANLSADFDYQLDFIVYGKNGVMGQLEPTTEITSHEIGIIIDCVADTQEHASPFAPWHAPHCCTMVIPAELPPQVIWRSPSLLPISRWARPMCSVCMVCCGVQIPHPCLHAPMK